jgi:hypothetical protein
MRPGLVRLWGRGQLHGDRAGQLHDRRGRLVGVGIEWHQRQHGEGPKRRLERRLRPGQVARHADWSSHGHAWPDALRQHRGRVHRDRGVRVLRRGVHGDDLHQRDGRHGPASATVGSCASGPLCTARVGVAGGVAATAGAAGGGGGAPGIGGADHQGGAGTASDTGGRRGVVRVRAAGAPVGLLRGFCRMPIDYQLSSFHVWTCSRGVPKRG